MKIKCNEVKVKFVPKYPYNDFAGTDPAQSAKCCKKCCFEMSSDICYRYDCVKDDANGYYKVVKIKS